MSKTAGQVHNSVNPDQMPHSVASDLGLHCLLGPFCPNNRVHTVEVTEKQAHEV